MSIRLKLGGKETELKTVSTLSFTACQGVCLCVSYPVNRNLTEKSKEITALKNDNQ